MDDMTVIHDALGCVDSGPCFWLDKEEQYQVNTARTLAEHVYVSWVTKPNGDVCDISKARDRFQGMFDYNQYQEWKILDVMLHREPKHYIDHFDRSKWPRDVVISVSQGEEVGEIGQHLAAIFTAVDLNGNINGRFDSRQEYTFGRVMSNNKRLMPLNNYLRDDDALLVFEMLYDCGNDKEEIMLDDDLLKAYFGSEDRGRTLLQGRCWNP